MAGYTREQLQTRFSVENKVGAWFFHPSSGHKLRYLFLRRIGEGLVVSLHCHKTWAADGYLTDAKNLGIFWRYTGEKNQ